jgi:hypothetical protein
MAELAAGWGALAGGALSAPGDEERTSLRAQVEDHILKQQQEGQAGSGDSVVRLHPVTLAEEVAAFGVDDTAASNDEEPKGHSAAGSPHTASASAAEALAAPADAAEEEQALALLSGFPDFGPGQAQEAVQLWLEASMSNGRGVEECSGSADEPQPGDGPSVGEEALPGDEEAPAAAFAPQELPAASVEPRAALLEVEEAELQLVQQSLLELAAECLAGMSLSRTAGSKRSSCNVHRLAAGASTAMQGGPFEGQLSALAAAGATEDVETRIGPGRSGVMLVTAIDVVADAAEGQLALPQAEAQGALALTGSAEVLAETSQQPAAAETQAHVGAACRRRRSGDEGCSHPAAASTG